MKKIIDCPTCHKPGTWSVQNQYRPFCSERCKLIDLGEWSEGNHRIPTDERIDDEDE